MRVLGTIWLVLVTGVIGPYTAEASHIYWTTGFGQSVERANLDGTGHETIVSGSNLTSNIFVDSDAAKVYWTGLQGRGISRSNLDGSIVELLVQPIGDPYGITLNSSTGTMYWAESSATNRIMRANSDGTGVQTFLALGVGYANDLSLDITHQHLYWTNTLVGAIYRSNLDGTGMVEILTTGISPIGLAQDLVGGKMYWTENGQNNRSIRRANLDGTGIENLVTGVLGNPLGIALDLNEGKMYWADHGYGRIQRANLDGSQIETILDNLGIKNPEFIALDVPIPEPASLALLALGGLLLRRRR